MWEGVPVVGMWSQALAPRASTLKSGWGGHLVGTQLSEALVRQSR